MCNVSNIANDWQRENQYWALALQQQSLQQQPYVTRAEFEALKAELERLKPILLEAKRRDNEDGNTDCEQADKVILFKKLAKLCDVDLSEIFT